jgi:uncharacterized surface anchored protein
LQFDNGIPDQCPPAEAVDATGEVFRAVPDESLQPDHFVSWIKAKKKSAKPKDCRHWGLSVWTSLEAVQHARKVNSHMCDQYIAKGALKAGDGRLAPTPTANQPMHHTLWCDINAPISTRFKIALPPVPEEAV